MNLYKQPWVWIIVFSVALSGAILYFGEEITLFQEEEVAVSVNNKEMNKKEFSMVLKQTEQNYAEMAGMTGEDFSEEEIRKVAVEMAVDQLLLVSYAEKMGLIVADEEIESFYAEIIGYEPEIKTKAELFDAWEEEGFDRAEMERQVRVYLLYDKIYDFYLRDVEVTEEDLEEAYNDYVTWIKEIDASEDEMMAFEEIKGELAEFIIQEKAIEKMELEIEEFRNESKIEVFI